MTGDAFVFPEQDDILVDIRFDHRLSWIHCEDWDSFAHIVAAGGAFGFVRSPLVQHRVHQRSPLAQALVRAPATRHVG